MADSKRSLRSWLRPPMILLGGALGLALFVMVRSAWVCDDALITFRTLENFVGGDGLRFNLAERVQSYTHPLWLFLLAPVYALTREAFYTPIFVSLICSGAALLVFASICFRAKGVAVAVIFCLLSSKAFVDYSTSGLENPLSHLLVALFLWLYVAPTSSQEQGPQEQGRRFAWLLAIGSLLFVNRMDAVLLVGPAILARWLPLLRSGRGVRSWGPPTLAGALPALLWVGFALVYYGTPLPNTAYAKLATGIDAGQLFGQGLFFIGHAFRSDPVTPLVITLALVGTPLYAVVRKDWSLAPLALGLGLQLLYIAGVGGDFMMGRFLSTAFFLSAMLLALLDAPSWKKWRRLGSAALVVICLGLSLGSSSSPWRSGPDYENRDQQQVLENRGIADERGFYYSRRGLLSAEREVPLHAHAQCRDDDPAVVIRSVCGELGYEGYTACPDLFLADRCALSDPLLARMPMIDTTQWRIGHFFRRVPAGYRKSLEDDANHIVTPHLRELYEDLRLVTRAPLFAPGRAAAIWRLHTFDYVPTPPRSGVRRP